MKNGLSRYSGILLVGIFVLSIFSIWLYEVNCGEGSPPQPPSPPPPCTVCCKCPADKPNCCGNECCAQANCCGNECHASAQYPCGTTCCDVPDTGSYGCCGNIPCCAGECCVKVTESPDPESDSGGTIKEYSYSCCSGGQKCCNGTCSECSSDEQCAEKYNSCYICDHSVTPCQCKMGPYRELTSWEDLENCPVLRQHPTLAKYSDGCSVPPWIMVLYGISDRDNPAGCGEETSFWECCLNHDYHYQTCDYNKQTADWTFGGCLHAVCNNLPGGIEHPCYQDCNRFANIYFEGVNYFGGRGYEECQTQYCVCCGQ